MHVRRGTTQILRSRAVAVIGIMASCVTAFLVLGLAGIFASLMFLPILAFLTTISTTSFGSPSESTPKNQRGLTIGYLSRFLGMLGNPTVAMIVEIDDFQRLEEVYGRDTLENALTFTQGIIEEHLTEADFTAHLDGSRFVSALAPNAPHDLETMLNTCTRIQQALSNVPLVTDLPMQITASIGFAASDKLERPSADALMQAALSALSEARRRAPGAVRAYSHNISAKQNARLKVTKDVKLAFESGEIFAYFQPQLNLHDGSLSGFEALTRWHHPERGIIPPADFLPTLERVGLMPQLGETMIKQALQALTFWDKSGMKVPRIGVNFSTSELRNPRLVDRIAMHLDVSNIAPHRLVVEVLETVIADGADDEIIANLAALSDLGCGIDLDDFGTGYASICNIRRFSVGRIKIARSFVTGIDTDPEQRNMIAAILTMAERLGVQTLAEGVETRAEREALHSLGCRTAQGFQIARPMPVQETVDWATAYFQSTHQPIQFSKRAS